MFCAWIVSSFAWCTVLFHLPFKMTLKKAAATTTSYTQLQSFISRNEYEKKNRINRGKKTRKKEENEEEEIAMERILFTLCDQVIPFACMLFFCYLMVRSICCWFSPCSFAHNSFSVKQSTLRPHRHRRRR